MTDYTPQQIVARGARADAEAAAEAIDFDVALEGATYSILEEDEDKGIWRIDAFPTTQDESDGINRVLAGFKLKVTTEVLADADWLAMALSGLPPVKAGRFFVYGMHDRGRLPASTVNLRIEAGAAFGTGHHGTTVGCLQAYDRLIKARGFKKEDFARYHPGGSLGRSLLLRVTEIMRTGDQLALLPPTATVHEVLAKMAKCRAGSAVLVHPDGSLAGVFTHGDFGRYFESVPDLMERPVGDYMTRSPITVSADKLAVEVLHILEKHAIDDLVAVDCSSGRPIPVGLVDTQDLAKFRLV